MKVIVRGRGLSLTAPVRSHVEAKVGKVTKFLPKLREARVVLSVEKYRHMAEVTLLGKQRTFHCAKATHDVFSAVDLAVEKLERQVRRTKDRIRHPKPRISRRRQAASPEGAEAPLTVISRRSPPKPMSLDEAMAQLGTRREGFLVFTNAATGSMNVLYRRRDGRLGLIEPA
jgi:putative sigma-54 modulation protein